MQRKTNKKGFTIVELVIVIAVIAILSAVLIPTFTSLVNKANMSADQQAVVNMNKILSYEETPETVDDVIEILIDNEYAGDLTTYYKKYSLAWVKSENKIVLIQDEKIAYPAQYVDKNLSYEIINPMATDAEALVGGLTTGSTVYVAENITLADGLEPTEAGDYLVNLNGNTIYTSDYVGSCAEDANLVISNGVIDATSGGSISVYADEGGYVELNNVQVYSAEAANPLQCYGGTMVLNNVTTAQYGVADTSWYNSAIMVVNNIKKDTDTNKYVIYGENANLTVNGGMYTGAQAIMVCAPGGNVTVNSGTFVGTTYAIKADFAPNNYQDTDLDTYESIITINGGTFTGAIKISTATTLIINGGTFSVDPTEWVSTGHTVVDNGNGTWTVK